MVNFSVTVSLVPPDSTITVTLNLPATVGLPLIAPLELSLTPAGRLPLAIFQTWEREPPADASFVLYTLPLVP